ncbi:MAG TPA: PfkB family carbohydrate kinase [Candidatus Bathyarchaeia archaeon]|nr:PfkB family carbohydrate kinase [Candidatus Bathyarchaeia archaeon]
MAVDLVITGNLNWDTNLFVKELPKPGHEIIVERIDKGPGGKGGNVAVAAARILGSKRVGLLACVGADDIGKKHLSILREEGVDISAIQMLKHFNSGQAYIMVDEKGRNMIGTHFGANGGLRDEHITSRPTQVMLASAGTIVIIDPPRQVVGKLFAEARRLRRRIIWHPGVLTKYGISEFERDMRDLDYLVMNEHEARQFIGARKLADSLSAISKVASKARILVTLGNKGSTIYSAGKLERQGKISVDKLGRKIINTTGSGDAFVGAFAAYKVMGLSDTEAFRYANLAGALKACRAETRGSPTGKELEKAYSQYWRENT